MWSCVNVVQVFKCLCAQSSFAARNSGRQPCSVKAISLQAVDPMMFQLKNLDSPREIFVYEDYFGYHREIK